MMDELGAKIPPITIKILLQFTTDIVFLLVSRLSPEHATDLGKRSRLNSHRDRESSFSHAIIIKLHHFPLWGW